MNENLSLFTALAVSGFLGSLGHCLGMCGPLVIMVGVQRTRSGKGNTFFVHLVYHSARIAVYGILGSFMGALGSLMGIGTQFADAAGTLSVTLGVGVILFGLGYLGWPPLSRLAETSGWLSRRMGQALHRGGFRGIMILGALNGLLPCGLVYSALLSAAATDSAIWGGVAMMLFGAATIPALMTVGVGAHMLSAGARQLLVRLAGAMILAVGVQLILRGMATLDLVPHLHWREIVLW
jgi:sulfite exporter TauE/SafE